MLNGKRKYYSPYMKKTLQPLNGWIDQGFGVKKHYVDDIIHNDDGPSIISDDGRTWWHQNGKLHRLDGPAFISISKAEKFNFSLWYYKGKCIGSSKNGYTQKQFDIYVKFRAFI